jgi:hypothetical protein
VFVILLALAFSLAVCVGVTTGYGRVVARVKDLRERSTADK